jgi:peptidoglycan/LPS O-acetylase OafA/YrhL
MSSTTAERNGSSVSNREPRSAAIDGLRGLCALALLSCHVAMVQGLIGTKEAGPRQGPTHVIGASILTGLQITTSVFFLMAGLFLYKPIAKSIIAGTKFPHQGHHMLRRGLRLLPPYWAMTLIALVTLNLHAINSVWYVVRPLVLMQVYAWGGWVNGLEVTWTVPVMAQYYIALPLIAWATHRYARRGATPRARAYRLMVPVPVLIAIGFGWVFFVKATNMGTRAIFWWPMGLAAVFAVGMAFGILLALAQVSPKDTPKIFKMANKHPNLFLLGAVGVLAFNAIRPFSEIGMDDIYTLSGLLVFYTIMPMFATLASLPLVAGGRSRVIKATMGNKPVVYVGRISYGVYLWHFAVMHYIMQPGKIFGDATFLFALRGGGYWRLEIPTVIGSVLIASISYYALERPLIAWGERFIKRREQASAALPQPQSTATVPTVMTSERAAAAVAAATADRDAIQANLLDLDGSFGKRLLAGATLTGHTKRRWEAANGDLTTLWEVFAAYSAVVDRAAELLSGMKRPTGPELAVITNLLTGPSVRVFRTPAPLDRRDLTDSGRSELTIAAAVREMKRIFSRVAQIVTAAEAVFNDVTDDLDRISSELDEAKSQAEGLTDEALTAAVAAAEAELGRRRDVLSSDPLAMWQRGRVDTSGLDRLREQTAAAFTRLEELSGLRDEALAAD